MVERKERASLDKDIFFLGWNEDFPSGRVLTCTLSLPSLLAPPRHLYLLHSLSSLAARVCSRLFLLRSLSALAVSTYFFTPGGVIPRSPSGRVCGGGRSVRPCFFHSLVSSLLGLLSSHWRDSRQHWIWSEQEVAGQRQAGLWEGGSSRIV